MENTRKRNNFQGIPFHINYADHFAPYSSIDEFGNVKGLLLDIVSVAAQRLNLTISTKVTRPENRNIWFKK